jgi:hypothetical protein
MQSQSPVLPLGHQTHTEREGAGRGDAADALDPLEQGRFCSGRGAGQILILCVRQE